MTTNTSFLSYLKCFPVIYIILNILPNHYIWCFIELIFLRTFSKTFSWDVFFCILWTWGQGGGRKIIYCLGCSFDYSILKRKLISWKLQFCFLALYSKKLKLNTWRSNLTYWPCQECQNISPLKKISSILLT